MGILQSLKEFFLGEEREVKEIGYGPKDIENVEDKYKKELGREKGRRAVAERKLKAKEEKSEALQEKLEGEYEIEDKIEDRRKLLEERRAEKILPLYDVPENTKVLSADYNFLGYFKGFSVDEDDATIGVLVAPERNSGRDEIMEVWKAKNMERLIKAPENIKSQLENGILVLTRNYAGDFEPDIFDEIEIPVERGFAQRIYS